MKSEVAGGMVELAFRYGSIDLAQIHPGQKIWKTDDPQAARRIRRTYASGQPRRRVPLDLEVEASVGSPMRVTAVAANGAGCRVESPQSLPEATKHPLTPETLAEQFGRLGKTFYQLRHVAAKLDGRAMIPLSELGKLRHKMLRQLDAAVAARPQRAMAAASPLTTIRPAPLSGPTAAWSRGDGSWAGVPPVPLNESKRTPVCTSSVARWTNSRRRSNAARRA